MQDLYIEVRVLNPVRFTDEKVEEIRALRESGETVPAIINATELHASILGFRNTIHLTFSPNVVLELGNQRQDPHDELSGGGSRIDRRVIYYFEAGALLGDFGNDPIEIRGARRSILVTNRGRRPGGTPSIV